MKYLVLLGTMLLSSLNAFASLSATTTIMRQHDEPASNPAIPATTDRFHQLDNLFAEGTLPTAEDIMGWRTGRCFLASDPNTPINVMLAGWMENLNDNAGPFFPGQQLLKAMSMGNVGQEADFFDSLNPTLINEINYIIASEQRDTTTMVENGSLVVNFLPTTRWVMRKSGNYIVKRWIESNHTYGMCYFFNKVR